MTNATKAKTCRLCEESKQLTEFYGPKRSLCKECERIDAKARMKGYNSTLRGRASQALQSARKTIKRKGYDVEDTLTLMDVLFTFAHADGECVYCERKTEVLTIDHIIPLSQGGPNSFANTVMSCRSCNASKGNRPVSEWADVRALRTVVDKMASRRGVNPAQVLEELRERGEAKL
ncbi:MAG TPA: HNH endonuclease [Bacillales bacterium]|nr:HNH endonuclease [Bacillales bacterium]